ncbi:MAG: UDP-N-acetylmuramoyl-tripeptide--D-alanyl-D-alanine ligase [Candidatus Omnitrophota bacterium]|nr:UDP-N-acetylmuramoyl-tripeptide--D-alanyl-D-alanine ligase [Candidatus Omnitrophota bacterium]
MIEFTVKDVAETTNGRLFSKKPVTLIKGFSIDSRVLKPGQFFIALEGKNFSGHDFIPEALEKGASGLIVEDIRDMSGLEREDHVICVKDTREAMGRIAAEIRRRVPILAVCITGTNGKTTTKDILAHILSKKFKVLKSAGSYNNIIGLSLTLFDLDPTYDVAVLELGSNHPGEIPGLARIAAPCMAVITNVGDGHLEHFANREGIFLEKISLLDFLPETGMAFLNRDDSLLVRAGARRVMKKFYGTSTGSDFLITGISRKGDGCVFSLNDDDFFIPLEGEHNVYNASAAIAVAEYFGVNPAEIRKALEEVSLPEMRIERTEVSGVKFINDSYNANPDSFECALKVLQNCGPGSRKGVVAGDMLELGDMSDEFHRMIGRSIAGKGMDFLIVLGEEAEYIIEGAIGSGMEKSRVLCAGSHEHAAEMLRQMAPPGTVVLLKGSREARIEGVLECFTTSCIH